MPRCPRCGKRWHDGDPLRCALEILIEGNNDRLKHQEQMLAWYEAEYQKVQEKYPNDPDMWDRLVPRRIFGLA